MRSFGSRSVAVAVVGGVLALGTAPAVGASVPAPAPSRATCEAFADYFQVEYLVAFATAFASLGDANDADKAATEIADTFHLILSPKMERVTRTLARGTSPALRSLFRRQSAAFAAGVELLAGAGITKAQLASLASLDLGPNTDLQAVFGDVRLDKQELDAAVADFHDDAQSLDLNAGTPRQQRAFAAAGTACGVFPTSDLDCADVVTTDEAAALLGGPTTVKSEDGTCVYALSTAATGGTTELAIDVYESSLAFDRLTQFAENPNIPGVGDAAVSIGGFSSFSSTNSCGRTVIAKQGERTVTVAACTGDTTPSVEALAGIANDVLARAT